MLNSINPVGFFAVTVGWIAFGAIMAGRIRRARASGAGGSVARDPMSIFGILLQAAALAVTWIGPLVFERTSAVNLSVSAASVALTAGSVWLFWSATKAMGENWSLVARTRSAHELVTHGPFASVRHPIYVAVFGMLIAGAAAVGHLTTLAVAAPMYWIGTMLRVSAEERLLHKTFGEAYRAYAARVKRFVPGLI